MVEVQTLTIDQVGIIFLCENMLLFKETYFNLHDIHGIPKSTIFDHVKSFLPILKWNNHKNLVVIIGHYIW